jgi:UDP-2-acetamido-3-amino-2,3-dideoxy-glucuronate N-acetyltransferase
MGCKKLPNIKQPTVIGRHVKFGPYALVWHWTTIEDWVEVGDYAVIGSHCFIGAFTTIGDNSRLQTGVFLPRYSKIGKNVFIGPHCCFTDDKYPQVRNHDYLAAPPILEDGCSIGAGSTILPGVRIGRGAMVGAGTMVVEGVPDYAVVVGNPSRIIKIREEEKTL